jgi:ABC-type multidrug transport system, ATPase component
LKISGLIGEALIFGVTDNEESVGFSNSKDVSEKNLDIARRMQIFSDRQCVSRIIQKLGLEFHKNKKAKNLSMGNKQRMGLAKAMIQNPEILILDEPINGLDPEGVVEIRNMLLDLSKNLVSLCS